MRMRWVAGLIARVPPPAAERICGTLAPLLAGRWRGGIDAWQGNLRSIGIPSAEGAASKREVLSHHLMLHYESLAMLGGRRFTVRIEGKQHLEAALRIGRGLLIATAHIGNWHVAAAEVHARTGREIHSVAGTQLLRAWTPWLRSAYASLGLMIHDAARSAARLTRALRSGEIVALHLDGDQHGQPGPATRGIVLLSRRTGAPILPAVTTRAAPGEIELRFLGPVSPGIDRIDRSTMNRILVDVVRHRPEQWVLFRPLWSQR
jgi:lauroyl/myristoyl acyltransferase